MGGRALAQILIESQSLGFLGPGDPGRHAEHARGLATGYRVCTGRRAPERCLDLGSGGGVPGLVLAAEWLDTELVLLDASARRCAALRRWVADLEWTDRVHVEEGRGEALGHQAHLREGFDLVVARAFGPPAVAAEIGSAFVSRGGHLMVSEPPHGTDRWPAAGLAALGLGESISWHDGASLVLLPKVAALADRYPRRVGLPAKRPLW